ncbi:acetate/propionate family kinase [Peteryoungia desertarenae]|uniref:Acetate kinase n=1 Tax=Peteryoungia desertarenae TaxID=1813451 RepID=A0ABX6QIP4_9HYPH|nr:acetate/propionate family kinase [Peteryoungia desertarenae]QLF68364.1 acetate/propionate family kinase [Peteryoungia desertarenae]
MKDRLILTFNAGSSTIKIGVFRESVASAQPIAKGIVDLRHDPLVFRLTSEGGLAELPLKSKGEGQFSGILNEILGVLDTHFDLSTLNVTGHRVVHGGDRFSGPTRITDETIRSIESLVELAPLHQPQNLRMIRTLAALRPDLPQTASFDTAFHRSQSPLVQRFALPREWYDRGVKRYGFHGLSYAYIARELTQLEPERAGGRAVVAHLGSGASLCAMEHGVSRDTSMGFSTVDGIPMATRSGALDPGVVFHLINGLGLSARIVEDMIYKKSGLLGLSGISGDSRVLLESAEPEAWEAIDIFTMRIAGEIARLAATVGGLDTIVFTAGIGENQPAIRKAVCDRLRFLGVVVDENANDRNAAVISETHQPVTVRIIATDEEQVIADEAVAALKWR